MTTKTDVCPDCSAPLRESQKYGWGTYKRYECGKVYDDGSGSPCPNVQENSDPILSVCYETKDGAFTTRSMRASEAETFLDANDYRRIRARTTVATASNAPNELAEIEKVRDGIASYMGPGIEDEIKELLKISDGVTVAGHTDGPKAGREAVHTILMRFVKFRTQMIEGAHKTYKAPIKALADLLDDRKRSLARMLEARETQLREDRDAFDKAEEKRIADERAERERQKAQELQNRLAAATEAGFVPDVAKASTLKDTDWKAYFDAEAQRVAENRRLLALVKDLGDLGDLCTLEEARELTVEQAAQRLEAAKVAKAELEERAERLRCRTELAMQLGWSVGAEWLATANEAAFQEGLKAATEAKEQRDRDAKELEALRESARQREAREKEEKEQREADERRQREEVERRQREQAEAEQREREKPEREKAVQWLRQMEMEALVPPVFAEERINALVSRRTVDILQAIQGGIRELEAMA